MMLNKKLQYGAVGVAALALAIGAGVLIGRHTTGAYAAEEPATPQNIASAAGAPLYQDYAS